MTKPTISKIGDIRQSVIDGSLINRKDFQSNWFMSEFDHQFGILIPHHQTNGWNLFWHLYGEMEESALDIMDIM